jgi:hypothetical protein
VILVDQTEQHIFLFSENVYRLKLKIHVGKGLPFQEKLTTTKFSLLSDVYKRHQKPDQWLLE